jgi:hypothetical protein
MNGKQQTISTSAAYEILLALTLLAVVLTVILVAVKCQTQYGTIFKILN